MNVLFLAAEVAPFVSVGGLSQVMYFLPQALQKKKHDVRIFMPKYASIDDPKNKRKWKLEKYLENLQIPIDELVEKTEYIRCNVKKYPKTRNTVPTYFLENHEYYELRANIYGYKDDHIRFALLSKGCLEWLLELKRKKNGWFPDVIQCNDWHTGYFIDLAKKSKRYSSLFEDVAVIFTVHNFHFQGNYDFRFNADPKQDTGTSQLAPLTSPKLQAQNALLRGILYADNVNTVSPTHAIEVLTPEYGEGLEVHLQRVRAKLSGILNGLDTKEFNPETDPIITKKYTQETARVARCENKKELQKLFLLEENTKSPLLAISGRVSQQKGWNLLLEVLPTLFTYRKDIQLIVLGNGDDYFRQQLQRLHDAFPKQMGLHLRTDFRLPRKLFAGADIMLIPSVFEPGGIVALEALRYGAVPLVRRTGGLNDIVTDFDPATKTGNGFSFRNRNAWELFATIIEALTIYKQPVLWNKLVQNCMQSDFSWKYSAEKYEVLYKNVLEEKRRLTSLTPHPAYSDLPTP